ncbi:hypothetical protein MXD63_41455 [Frankia sp. Cpl3]|nr:hypothetical protein [Frankia sp. Cpl3]
MKKQAMMLLAQPILGFLIFQYLITVIAEKRDRQTYGAESEPPKQRSCMMADSVMTLTVVREADARNKDRHSMQK